VLTRGVLGGVLAALLVTVTARGDATPSPTADRLIDRADKKRDNGDLDGAIADYTQALAVAPKSFTAYADRGYAKYLKKDYAGALEDCNRALDLNPDYPDAYVNRADIEDDQGRHGDAIADYTRALDLEPDNSDT
jgi:tetratricopeptide (TPR) repeat protein